jgi:hypothetical protein
MWPCGSRPFRQGVIGVTGRVASPLTSRTPHRASLKRDHRPQCFTRRIFPIDQYFFPRTEASPACGWAKTRKAAGTQALLRHAAAFLRSGTPYVGLIYPTPLGPA